MAWDVLVNYSTMFPPYYLMERAYEDYRHNAKPAGLHPSNQCAVRMSVALGRCGFTLDYFPVQHRIHTSPDVPVSFVQGAHELASYLGNTWGRPQKFKQNLRIVGASLKNKTGIVYFNNCFQRKGETVKQGDHIDLWNGSTYYNRIYKVKAGEEDRLSGGDLFGLSDEVWFFPLV